MSDRIRLLSSPSSPLSSLILTSTFVLSQGQRPRKKKQGKRNSFLHYLKLIEFPKGELGHIQVTLDLLLLLAHGPLSWFQNPKPLHKVNGRARLVSTIDNTREIPCLWIWVRARTCTPRASCFSQPPQTPAQQGARDRIRGRERSRDDDDEDDLVFWVMYTHIANTFGYLSDVGLSIAELQGAQRFENLLNKKGHWKARSD